MRGWLHMAEAMSRCLQKRHISKTYFHVRIKEFSAEKTDVTSWILKKNHVPSLHHRWLFLPRGRSKIKRVHRHNLAALGRSWSCWRKGRRIAQVDFFGQTHAVPQPLNSLHMIGYSKKHITYCSKWWLDGDLPGSSLCPVTCHHLSRAIMIHPICLAYRATHQFIFSVDLCHTCARVWTPYISG